MLLEILRTFERLAAEVAFVRLERNVNTDVRSDVITLDCGSAAVAPLARQVQVVGALAPNVTFANVILRVVSLPEVLGKVEPEAIRERIACSRELEITQPV